MNRSHLVLGEPYPRAAREREPAEREQRELAADEDIDDDLREGGSSLRIRERDGRRDFFETRAAW